MSSPEETACLTPRGDGKPVLGSRKASLIDQQTGALRADNSAEPSHFR